MEVKNIARSRRTLRKVERIGLSKTKSMKAFYKSLFDLSTEIWDMLLTKFDGEYAWWSLEALNNILVHAKPESIRRRVAHLMDLKVVEKTYEKIPRVINRTKPSLDIMDVLSNSTVSSETDLKIENLRQSLFRVKNNKFVVHFNQNFSKHPQEELIIQLNKNGKFLKKFFQLISKKGIIDYLQVFQRYHVEKEFSQMVKEAGGSSKPNIGVFNELSHLHIPEKNPNEKISILSKKYSANGLVIFTLNFSTLSFQMISSYDQKKLESKYNYIWFLEDRLIDGSKVAFYRAELPQTIQL